MNASTITIPPTKSACHPGLIASAFLLVWLASAECLSAAGSVTPALGVLDQSNVSAAFSTSTFTPASVGYQFTANADLLVRSLGLFDLDRDGLSATHQVGIYELSGALLRVANIGPGSALRGDFRYENLASPLTVSSGTSLRIAHFVNGDPWVFRAPTSGFSPLVTYDGAVFASGTPVSLSYPGSVSSTRQYLGSDFEFEVVPEPSTALMAAVWLGGILMVRRRRGSIRSRGFEAQHVDVPTGSGGW